MDSRSSTISADKPPSVTSSPPNTPKPPVHLFRTIRRVDSSSSQTCATYLCLPRKLSSSTDQRQDEDEDFQAQFTTEHDAFTKLENASIHEQLGLLKHRSLSNSLVQSINRTGASHLTRAQLAFLPQLMLVKLSTDPENLREEEAVLEALNAGREEASLHLGPAILQSQFAQAPAASFLCLRPVFGATLAQFGQVYLSRSGIPSSCIAHIFLGLLDAVEYVHANGITLRGNMTLDNVRLNMHPVHFFYRYRGYPDVLLTEFTVEREAEGEAKVDPHEKDARAILGVVNALVRRYSDTAIFINAEKVDTAASTDDPMMLLVRDIQEMLDDEGMFGVENVRSQFGGKLVDLRHEGPQEMPFYWPRMVHDDLVTAEEMEAGLKEA